MSKVVGHEVRESGVGGRRPKPAGSPVVIVVLSPGTAIEPTPHEPVHPSGREPPFTQVLDDWFGDRDRAVLERLRRLQFSIAQGLINNARLPRMSLQFRASASIGRGPT